MRKVLNFLVVLFATLLILTFFCFGFYTALNFGQGWSDISIRIVILMTLFSIWMMVLFLLYYILTKVMQRYQAPATNATMMVSWNEAYISHITSTEMDR